MTNFKKITACLLLFLIACFFTLNYNIKTTSAALTTDDAIKKAPSGINIADYFTHGTSNNTKFKTNSAKIVDNHPDVMDLASGNGSVGAYWSNMDNQNYIDLTDTKHTQKISAWLYFGDGSGGVQLNGEGMALVLQNDPNKTNAMGAGYEGLGVYGNDWATQYWDNNIITGSVKEYKYPSTYTNTSIASTAVQKSIAIEFDSEKDVPYSSGESILSKPIGSKYYTGLLNFTGNQDYSMNSFDMMGINSTIPSDYPDSENDRKYGGGGGYGHIAVTYPGLASSYAKASTQDSNFSKGFSLIHINEDEDASLIDDDDAQGNPVQWHHLTVKWTPNSDGTATLSYSFNDIDPNNLTINKRKDQNSFNRVDGSVKVDYKSLFGDTSKIYWGMTGSNSASDDAQDKLVDFESIPALLTLDTDSSIVDHTLNDKTIKPKTSDTDTSDRTVGDGDNLSLNYQLSYNYGRVPWKNVTPTINLPKYFTANTDNLGTIKYMSGTNGTGSVVKTENISTSDLSGTTITIPTLDSEGTGLLGDSDSKLPQSLIVTINGKATNDTTSNQTASPAASRFVGTNEISDISSPEFIVRYKKNRKLQLSPKTDSIDLPYNNQDAGLTLPTTLTYDDNSKFEASPTGTIYYTVKVADQTFNYVYDPSDVTSTTNNIDLKSDILNGSTDQSKFWNIFKSNTTQKITVSATDQDGITSNTATFTVNVIPDKTLSVTANSFNFKDIQQFNDKELLERKSSPNVTVQSLNTPWKLYAEGSDLTNSSGKKFNGNLIYKASDNSKSENLYGQSIYIGQDLNSSATKTTKIISNTWDKKSGVLLNETGSNIEGTYSGKITWNAVDSL